MSALAATGLAVGAVLAVPLGPWVEFRRKRPVMVGLDLLRCAVLLTVPAAAVVGVLSVPWLLVVSVVVAAADIGFRAASGACLKALVRGDDLLVANARFESTTWTATVLGPPAGGAAIALFGPLATVVANAASFALSALGIRAIGRSEPPPARPRQRGAGELLDGWRHILASPALRPLFLNTVLVNALILASAPLMAVLMLGELGFAFWQYSVAFGVPCVGGLVGARLSPRLVARFGRHRVLRVAGTLRACWPVGLAFVGPAPGGIVLVMALQFGMLVCIGVFNPVYVTDRLRCTEDHRVARTLAAWSVATNATVAAVTAGWGVLAATVGPRGAVAAAGCLLLATPFLLPRRPVEAPATAVDR